MAGSAAFAGVSFSVSRNPLVFIIFQLIIGFSLLQCLKKGAGNVCLLLAEERYVLLTHLLRVEIVVVQLKTLHPDYFVPGRFNAKDSTRPQVKRAALIQVCRSRRYLYTAHYFVAKISVETLDLWL
jgi:hypothetical protein